MANKTLKRTKRKSRAKLKESVSEKYFKKSKSDSLKLVDLHLKHAIASETHYHKKDAIKKAIKILESFQI